MLNQNCSALNKTKSASTYMSNDFEAVSFVGTLFSVCWHSICSEGLLTEQSYLGLLRYYFRKVTTFKMKPRRKTSHKLPLYGSDRFPVSVALKFSDTLRLSFIDFQLIEFQLIFIEIIDFEIETG